MSKAELKFNLPEENDDFILAVKGKDYWSCLWDLDQECRAKLKYGFDKQQFKSPEDVFEWVREFICNRVDLEEIS